MALLNVNKLSVQFGDPLSPFKAVDRISYSIDAGQVVGIVGESGRVNLSVYWPSWD